jgi:sigma-B regulation protein RsbU (phosphoserine phosphatase)
MRQLSYVNAAQVPPVVIRSNGKIERLEDGGTAVGMFPMARYQQASVSLEPGDAVVCFSDGISEAANLVDEMWDEDKYLGLLQRSTHLNAQQMVQALVAGADAFAGEAEQADDMTVVVLKAVTAP